MTSKRNKKVRRAIQLIVDAQRGSSDWISLYEWVDLIDATLKVMSQWGHNILIWNRQIGCMLSKHPDFAKTYHLEEQRQIPMYKINIEDIDSDYIITQDNVRVRPMRNWSD